VRNRFPAPSEPIERVEAPRHRKEQLMKNRRHQLVRPLVIAAVVAGIVVAPAARAVHQDPGTPAALTAVQDRQRAPVTRSVTIVEPSAFDWGDAGVGAAAAFGLMLVAGGVVLAFRHNHRTTS
jgi:hypothetical protein